jgi:ribosomal protein L40E
MTDRDDRAQDERANSEEMERTLARRVAVGLPAASVVGAIGVGVAAGVGPAILVLAAGGLVSVIALLWASLRTLGGDAPLAEGFATVAIAREQQGDAAARKRRVLRALKDLELEHSVGKIDDEDYAEISGRYRDQAKAILREQDVQIEPLRTKAEEIARAHLRKKGLLTNGEQRADKNIVQRAHKRLRTDEENRPAARLDCPKCETSNEPDATFCKKCGAKLGRLACASCATSNEPDATFCKKCGGSLTEPVAEAKDA